MTKDEFDAQLLRELSLAYAELDQAHADLLQMEGEHLHETLAFEQAVNRYKDDLRKLQTAKSKAQSRVDLLEDRVRKMLRDSAPSPSIIDKLRLMMQSKIGRPLTTHLVEEIARDALEIGATKVSVHFEDNGLVQMTAEVKGRNYMFEILPDGLVVHKEIRK